MINLLSPDSKQLIRAARTNILLRRYMWFIGLTAVLVFATFGIGYYLTHEEKMQKQSEIDARTMETTRYDVAKKNAEQFSADLATAKSILANEIVFSDLLLQLTDTLPSGIVLSELQINTTNLGKEISILARGKNSQSSPLALKAALEASPLFSNVKIIDVTESNTANTQNVIESRYPVAFELRATLDAKAGKRSTIGATQ